jgi:integrase
LAKSQRQNLHRGKNLKSQHAITLDECSSRALALLEQSVEGAMSNVEEKTGSGLFAKLHGLTWEPPIYKPNYEMPFIPTEAEIDQLIAACGKKLSALLQLIKETGVRIGEACRIRWIDLDLEQKIIRVQAEKNSKPRIFRISDKLISMLNMLPKKNERIFPNIPQSLENRFRTARKRIALKLNNPRLMEIHFHTIRHWRATMLYHQTKDILHVKEFLGHRREIKALLEVGFEYVCEKDGLLFFRKRNEGYSRPSHSWAL